MRLMHNIAAFNIFNLQNKILDKQNTALQRISSGIKISSSKDDPNALASSERMRIQILGLQMAQKNVQDGTSMLQTADGGLDSITQMLQRIRELTVQASSDSTNAQDKGVMQNEIKQMISGINDVAKNTEFNGVKMLSTEGKLSTLVGANANDKLTIPTFDITSSKLKNTDGTLTLDDIDVTSADGISKAFDIIDSSINTVTKARSKYGAIANRFESSFDSLGQIGDIIQGAQSQIGDADIALEMAEYAKDNILVEAGTAMMVQANKFPQEVLSILNNR